MIRNFTLDSLRRPPAVGQIIRPFQRFFRAEAASGILLILAVVTAMIWANSRWAETYFSLLLTDLTVGYGALALSKPLILWINDGLMAIFFFVVGLEVKREFFVGELSNVRNAVIPVAAAIGGMAVPAIAYFILNPVSPESRGWAIPMATDIALALGILSLVGRRAALPLRVFLAALAIIDDLGSIVVMVLFYTETIVLPALLASLILLVILFALNRMGARRPLVYAVFGVLLWLAVLQSGVHATLAGVLLALTIPSRTAIHPEQFLVKARTYIEEFEMHSTHDLTIMSNRDQRAAVQAMERACQEVESPLQRLEHGLHPWVAYFIVPVFALANAGIPVVGEPFERLVSPVSIGVIIGLLLGKQLGIFAGAWLAARSGLGKLPGNMSWRQVYGAAWLGGIGFTMSIFIANLAFGLSPLLFDAKVGVLAASVVAAAGGWLILRRSTAGLRADSSSEAISPAEI